ncbi:MAG: phytanoyl-CoA dioxygenase family protein [Candidatus Latescibacteria bacterium]|nr:phytanoyl-CoA dioxygenase family protein [Candidatus Latescibacterota bacterium]
MSLTRPIVEPCPSELTDDHRKQYSELGYVAFEGVLSEAEVTAARQALKELTHRLMQAARRGEGEVKQARPGAARNYAGSRVVTPGGGCAIHFEAGVEPLELSDEEAESRCRKVHGYENEHPTFQTLTAHPRIQGLLSELIGQQLILKDVMALSKPPFIGSEKPWHQDNAYFNYLPLELLATVWIAIDDATAENGCMHVLPGQHRRGPLMHFHSTDCEIIPDRIDPALAVPVPLAAGGIMLFSAMLPHQTPPNLTASRRRALQFQYRGVGTHQVSKEEYGRVFAEADGSPATCALAHENG